MSSTKAGCPSAGRLLSLSLAAVLIAGSVPSSSAETITPESVITSVSPLLLPREYGEIIYRSNEKSPNQLFIIGMSHRDTFTLANGKDTPKAQAEAYMIGEWLIRHEGLELLLPEGFFSRKAKNDRQEHRAEKKPDRAEAADIRIIEERLSDNGVFINAEMLLREYYVLNIRQVEDRKFYDAVGECLLRLNSCGENSYDYLSVKSELDYLQERRTAAMLQRAPEAVDNEFDQGAIKSKKALLTIGMNHVREIVQYLRANKIAIYPPLFSQAGAEDYIADLNLIRENYGVTIIIPRVLADDKEILKRTGLDKSLASPRSSGSAY